PADVHIYGIDCGAGALLPVSELPHCGAVVAREQTDRVERLLSKLRNEIARRQQLLAAQGFAGLAEQRAATSGEERLPWMLLLLDPDPTGLAQVSALRRIADDARRRYGRLPRDHRPLRVDALPPRITVAETYRLDPDFAPPSPLWAMVGAGGDELSPQGLDVAEEGP